MLGYFGHRHWHSKRYARGRIWLAGLVILMALALPMACDGNGEDRPTIEVIQGSGAETGSVSGTGTGTGSVSGTGKGTGSGSVSGVVEPGVVQPKPAGAKQVNVGLSEWAVTPDRTQVEAGSIYFLTTNSGPDDAHELVIVKTDLAPDQLPVVDGLVPEDQVDIIGEIEPFEPGTAASGVFNLQPGNYVLICNIAEIENGSLESHYQLGMRIAFTVTGTVSGTDGARGLSIPTGLTAETEGPTKSDGYYTATTNREIYQKISTDYQEIAKQTNVVNEGKPLPAAEIWLLYEAGSHTRIGNSSRTLRSFAIGSSPSTYFPDSAEFYGSDTFLDDPIENAIRGRREAENYTDAQKRQAIQKGALRVIYHWTRFYMIIGQDRSSSRLIDESWAIYVGEEVNGKYPNSVAAVAQAREGNFGRQGKIDVPLRQAMDRARQAADDMDEAALEAAIQEVFSRFNAIFYLSTVRYIGRVLDDAQAGDRDALGTHQVEAMAFYQSIQPDVAKANPSADETIVAYLTAELDQITTASRDGALVALNGTAAALLLTQDDLVTRFDDDTGNGPSGVPSPYTGELDLSSSMFIPVGLPLETSGPTKSDGYYYPTTNREHYQKISSDYQEIAKLTNVIQEGEPLPAADIFLLYQVGMHTRIGVRSKTLRSFARDPERAEEYPVAAEFYGSARFLDSPVSSAISGRGAAEEYTDAQRRQAINKGILRVLYHWSKHYVIGGCADLDSGDVDEGWAIYVGLEVDGDYPNSLSQLARNREANFGREGTIDIPLRQAFERVRQAAENGDSAACDTAAQKVYSRFNAIFYLATVRYIGRVQDDAQAGNSDALGVHQVEALAFYQSIQPEVAEANAASDETIIAYLEADADQITEASRDEALAALNRAASALLLSQEDLVTSFE